MSTWKSDDFFMRKNVRVKRDTGFLKMVVRNVSNIIIYGLCADLARDDDIGTRKHMRMHT